MMIQKILAIIGGLTVAAVFILLVASQFFSNTESNDFDAVRKSQIVILGETINVGPSISAMTGADGSVTWERRFPKDKQKYPDTVWVGANITKPGKKKSSSALLGFMYNRQTGEVVLSDFQIDGKPQTTLAAALLLQSGIF